MSRAAFSGFCLSSVTSISSNTSLVTGLTARCRVPIVRRIPFMVAFTSSLPLIGDTSPSRTCALWMAMHRRSSVATLRVVADLAR